MRRWNVGQALTWVSGLLVLTVFMGRASDRTGESLLLSLQWETPPASLAAVKNKLKETAQASKGYFSLGESHDETESTQLVDELLLKDFVGSLADPKKARFCSEKIDTFLKAPVGKWLQASVGSTLITEGNSPTKTDFGSCADGSKKIVTYSGFFHQFPFARPFPQVFGSGPVLTEPGNNIADQLPRWTSVLIAQVEWAVLEMFETNRLFKGTLVLPAAFREEVTKLTQAGSALRSRMEPLTTHPSPYRAKRGVFVGRAQLSRSAGAGFPNDSSWILLTDLEARSQRGPFEFLNALAQWSDADLSRLLAAFSQQRAFFTRDRQEPTEDGRMIETGYGRFGLIFTAHTHFLAIPRAGQAAALLAWSPLDGKFRCFFDDEVACADWIKSI